MINETMKRKQFTKENAAYYGRLGGSKSSPRKTYMNQINPIKNGKYVKSEEIISLVIPTQLEKIMGLERENKIRMLKAFARNNPAKFFR